jgi:uncharacterized protein YecT (DUF1311 family)
MEELKVMKVLMTQKTKRKSLFKQLRAWHQHHDGSCSQK